MRNDIKNHIDVAPSIAPGGHSGGSVTGADVDLANFDAAAVVVDVGEATADDFSFTVEHADDDGEAPGSYESVPEAELDGQAPGTAAADTVTTVGYHGTKRWLRVVATDGGTGDASFGAAVVRAKGRVKP